MRETFRSVKFVPLALNLKISELREINLFLEDAMKKGKDLFLRKQKMDEAVENRAEFPTEKIGIRTQPQIPRRWEDVLISGPPPQKVNITLDTDTAFPRLILSEDLRSVRWDKKYQDLPENPGRFNLCPIVLGREELSEGRYFWDVSVESEEEWTVGVALKSVTRKGPVMIQPESGIWAIGLLDLPLCRNEKLRKIRVFLSCTEGLVTFYNTDTEDFLYEFSGASFRGQPILPFFRVFVGGHLKICH
nr:butyrophilin subfamily 2 member A2-like [Anolis sagrei ordinatus]